MDAQPRPEPDLDSTPAKDPTDPVEPARRRRAGRPPSVNAISIILLVVGAAIEGYAVALTVGDSSDRQYSLIWAALGAALVVTAWALRGRRWWGAAAAIGVSIVGLFAGMLGVYGVLVIASAGTADQAGWLATLGLIGVGAASIAIIGLLSSAWPWLMATTSRQSLGNPSPTA